MVGDQSGVLFGLDSARKLRRLWAWDTIQSYRQRGQPKLV